MSSELVSHVVVRMNGLFAKTRGGSDRKEKQFSDNNDLTSSAITIHFRPVLTAQKVEEST